MFSEYYAVFAYIRAFHREASHPSPKLQVAIASFSTGFYFNEVALDVNPGINFEERERERKIVYVCVCVKPNPRTETFRRRSSESIGAIRD